MAFLLTAALSGCTASKTTFYAFADLPYKENEVEKLKNGVQAINRDGAHQFSVHLGDIKAGRDSCTRFYYEQLAGLLKGLDKTTFIIPGDNEWNDCTEPEAAWRLWEAYFMGFEDNWNSRRFVVNHQPSRPENFAFLHRKCLFLGLNLVGGRVHDEAEWEQRLADNAEWLAQNFESYGRKAKCAVVFGHAQPPSDTAHLNQRFFNALQTTAAGFGRPILFMHGDGHVLELERFLAPNVLRFELNGGKESDWLMKIVVEAGKRQPFSFLLPAPRF